MKSGFVFLIILCTTSWSFGQAEPGLEKRVVSLYAQNKSGDQILLELGQELGFSISYNADLLKNREITILSDSISLREVIDSLFFKKDLRLRLIGSRQLVVFESTGEALVLDTCYQTIEGVLIDGFTEQELARASIRELTSNQLTITNRDGRFLIKVPCDQEEMQLEISAMGYRSRFINQAVNREIETIVMEGDYVALKDVYILSVHAEQLMEEVLKGVCDNYMNRPTKATSFFREAILKNNKMIALSEAVFDVYNHPYTSPGKKDQVQLVKGRKFSDHLHMDTLAFKLKGSLRSCFELDVVKNQPFFFNLNFYKDTYEYSFNTVMEFNGRDVYVIDFKHRPTAEGIPYEGKMFIDKACKSLISIEFELNRRTLRNREDQFVIKKSKDFKARIQNARYHIHYTDVEGKLAMNYVGFTSNFKVRKKNGFFSAKYETISEYVVNQFLLEDVNKIRSRNTFSAEKIFMDEPMEYNDEYWEGVNYFPIDKPLLDSSEELKKMLAAKQEISDAR